MEESQKGAYEEIEAVWLYCSNDGTSYGMVNCLLLGALRGSFYWSKVGYNKNTELGFNYGK